MGDEDFHDGSRSRRRKHDEAGHESRGGRSKRPRHGEDPHEGVDERSDTTKQKERGRGKSYSPDRRERRDPDHRREKHQRRDTSRDKRRRRSPDSEGGRSDAAADRERHRRRRSRDGSRSRRRDKGRADSDEAAETARDPIKRGGPLPSQADSFALVKGGEDPLERPKEQPNMGNTGLLAAASNSVEQADGTTITLKYHEPPEARKPPQRDQWKLFVFKGADIADTIDLSARSCWLLGRETTVVDLPAEHPSISKQHAVVQFRYTEKRNEFGDKIGRVKPYLIDLESANGTQLNGEKIPASRYLELRHKDMVQFGLSTREYVLMLAPRD